MIDKVIKIINVYVYRQCKMSIKRLITTESKRVKEKNNTPDSKGSTLDIYSSVFPQEKVYIDVFMTSLELSKMVNISK